LHGLSIIQPGGFSALSFYSLTPKLSMTDTLSCPILQWENGTQWSQFPELGSIYSEEVTFYTVDNAYQYKVSFLVKDGRQLGLLFVEVEQEDPQGYNQTLRYSLGQFYSNDGAIKFAQFALEHFYSAENWAVCPSFQYVDMIDGDPFTLAGDEIVSEIA
jgi:hypothetical protein